MHEEVTTLKEMITVLTMMALDEDVVVKDVDSSFINGNFQLVVQLAYKGVAVKVTMGKEGTRFETAFASVTLTKEVVMVPQTVEHSPRLVAGLVTALVAGLVTAPST